MAPGAEAAALPYLSFRDGVRIAAWRAGRGNDGHRAALPWRRGHFRIDPMTPFD